VRNRLRTPLDASWSDSARPSPPDAPVTSALQFSNVFRVRGDIIDLVFEDGLDVDIQNRTGADLLFRGEVDICEQELTIMVFDSSKPRKESVEYR